MEEGAAWLAGHTLEMDAYNFSKAALIVWTMRTAWEWRRDGPRLNCVSPGAVDTPILGDFHASMGPILGAVTALVGRDGRPEDIAPAVCFLASSESSWINGVNLIADGGFAGGMATGAVDVAALLGGGAP
jgi:NAD(P)-dependent dehydrogenase (short-subunit alcohol dehydrogenase family)